VKEWEGKGTGPEKMIIKEAINNVFED